MPILYVLATCKSLSPLLFSKFDLIWFDLSAVFDTVDHDILLTQLKVSFGINGAALDWFQS